MTSGPCGIGVEGVWDFLRRHVFPATYAADADPAQRSPTPPRTGRLTRQGEILLDPSNGDFFACVGKSTNVEHQYLRFPQTRRPRHRRGLQLLSAPAPVIDTRSGSGLSDAGNPLIGRTAARTYNAQTLATAAGFTLPASATAIYGRASVLSSTGNGNLLISPANPPASGSGVQQIVSGGADGTFFLTRLDTNGNFHLTSSLPGGTQTDFIIVFIGFYS